MGQRCRGWMELGTHIWHPPQIFLQGQMTSQRRESLGSRLSNALPKDELRVFLTGYNVLMVTYYVKKTTITCLPMIRHLFDTIIAVSADVKSGGIDPSKYNCWKQVPATITFLVDSPKLDRVEGGVGQWICVFTKPKVHHFTHFILCYSPFFRLS